MRHAPVVTDDTVSFREGYPMRPLLLALVASCSACQTVEFQVDHSMTGVHVAAKFEAKDEVQQVATGPALISPR